MNRRNAYLSGLFIKMIRWVECSLFPGLRGCSQKGALLDQIFFSNEGDGYKVVSGCANVIKSPVPVIIGQQLLNTLNPVEGRYPAIAPIKQFDPVVKCLLLPVDRYVDFNVLFTR